MLVDMVGIWDPKDMLLVVIRIDHPCLSIGHRPLQ